MLVLNCSSDRYNLTWGPNQNLCSKNLSTQAQIIVSSKQEGFCFKKYLKKIKTIRSKQPVKSQRLKLKSKQEASRRCSSKWKQWKWDDSYLWWWLKYSEGKRKLVEIDWLRSCKGGSAHRAFIYTRKMKGGQRKSIVEKDSWEIRSFP